ncbi:MAG: hypothetical protein HQ547_01060 [Candidatus Omnitrophica bacterium]|nr:hypothetical protein [Candidatus Omnitrophota bacterium]
MQKSVVILLVAVLGILASPALASQNKISTTYETGNISVTDFLEERDSSGNVEYYRFFTRFDTEISELTKLNFSYRRYYKDYETSDNLDADSNIWHFGVDHTLKGLKLDPVKMDFDFGFSQKDYRNSPSREYERSNIAVGLSHNHEDLWAVNWKSGFINYDYQSSNADQLKIFTKLGSWMKFFDKRLKINPSYKLQSINYDGTGKDRAENTLRLASSYKVGLPHLSKVESAYKIGRNDTKDSEDEDRDDDLWFKYKKWHITSKHPLIEKIDTSFKYGWTKRDYQDGGTSYQNYFVENKTKFKIFEDKVKKINLSVKTQHKESDFNPTDSRDYIKELIKTEFLYRIKNNWELVPSFTFKHYNHPSDATGDERKSEAKIEFLKKLFANNLDLKLTYKYIRKQSKFKADTSQWSIKTGIDVKF